MIGVTNEQSANDEGACLHKYLQYGTNQPPVPRSGSTDDRVAPGSYKDPDVNPITDTDGLHTAATFCPPVSIVAGFGRNYSKSENS